MKILIILPYIPTPPTFGGALRNYHILKHLTQNHDVKVAGFYGSGSPEEFLEYFPELKDRIYFVNRRWKGKRTRLVQVFSLFTSHSSWYYTGYSNELMSIVKNLASNENFDIIQAESPVMARYQPDGFHALRIMDAHNVEHDNLRRMAEVSESRIMGLYYSINYPKIKNEELFVAEKQDAIFTTSNRDKSLFDKEIPNVKKFVIPNGVDTDYFKSNIQECEPNALVFTGLMEYAPNADGILYFLDSIFPRIQRQIPDIKIYVVGKKPPKALKDRENSNIVVTGFVEDVRPYIERASVYVVPLRMGGGTRLKVLEALSMKKPVVTSSIGCEGIDVIHNETALIKDKPDEFADSVVKLVKDKGLRSRLSKAGYEFVKEHFDWRVIGKNIDHAYNSLIKQVRV